MQGISKQNQVLFIGLVIQFLTVIGITLHDFHLMHPDVCLFIQGLF